MTDVSCDFEGCEAKAHSKKLCKGHYSQQYKGKSLTPINRVAPDKLCSYEGCLKIRNCASLCVGHYWQYSHGKPLKPLTRQRLSQDLPWQERATYAVYQSVLETNDCHIWSGSLNRGYGTLFFDKKRWLAHRLMYCVAHDDLYACGSETVHHKCATPACVNPDHLELATHRENNAEMFERKAYIKTIKTQELRIKELEALLITNNITF